MLMVFSIMVVSTVNTTCIYEKQEQMYVELKTLTYMQLIHITLACCQTFLLTAIPKKI
jgi:hypothetical protein